MTLTGQTSASAWWDASQPSSPGLDLSILFQYGAVGLLAAIGLYASATLFKRLVSALERERDRADRLEQELRTLNQTTQDTITQALGDATRAIADALDTVGNDPRRRLPPRYRGGSE